jgi:hypothetical protein
MAEEVLQRLQSILYDSVKAGLIPRYKRKPVQDEEYHDLEEIQVPEEVQVAPSLSAEASVQDEEYHDLEEIQVPQEVQVAPSLSAEASVQVKVEEDLQVQVAPSVSAEASVQVQVEEVQVAPSVSAEDVILYHELKIVQINIQWFTTDLVKAHCESRSISTNGKPKAQMLQELKDALNGTPSPLINAAGLVHLYEKKQKEHDFKLSDLTILRLHSRYHGLPTIGYTKAVLRERLRIL